MILFYILGVVAIACVIYIIYRLNYLDNFHTVENSGKDQLLRVMDKIRHIKMLVPDLNNLIQVICQSLKEELKGKFNIILAGNFDDSKLNKYHQIIKEVSSKKEPFTLHQNNKTIYFYPLFNSFKNIGILIAEFNSKNSPQGINYVFKKYSGKILDKEHFLLFLADQISIVVDNFEARINLSESKINEEKEKLRSLILSSISHDLKTPLHSIIASLSTIGRFDKLNEKDKKTLIDAALNEAERLNSYISDILKMTRIESGAIKLTPIPLSPAAIVEKTAKIFEKSLKDYEFEVSLNEKVEVEFDKVSLEQIMQNLIENTIKYSFKNTKISIYDKIKPNLYSIFIKDEGMGIDKAKLDSIFNKFERLDSKNKATGTGLGLSITKALVELNNATISVKNSEDGKGAIFILEFKNFKL